MWLVGYSKSVYRCEKAHLLMHMAHSPENLMSHKEPVRAEYLPSSCTKFISIVYLSS